MSVAASILSAVEATLAGVSGLSSARVLRGIRETERTTPPSIQVWIAGIQSTRGPVSHRYTVRLTLGIRVHAQASATTTSAIEGAALELAHAVVTALQADPSCGGYAHDVEEVAITDSGSVVLGDEAPSPWLVGTATIRYAPVGGL